VNESLRSHGMTIGLSCLLHAGLVACLVLGQQWITVAIARPPVLRVQLVTLDAEEPRPEPPAPPAPRPRERLKPPRLIETPTPKNPPPPAKAEPAPLPPLPMAATAPPVAPVPVDSAPTLVPSDAVTLAAPPMMTIAPSVPATGPAAPGGAPITAAIRPSTAVPEGLTEYARPQGGYQVRPSYPAAPRRLGIQGTTMLRVHVLADGRIGDVRVQESAGHPELDDAAVDAVRRWRFEPARRGAEAIAMWVLLPVEFRLR
jgi:periplasmic protein TonB